MTHVYVVFSQGDRACTHGGEPRVESVHMTRAGADKSALSLGPSTIEEEEDMSGMYLDEPCGTDVFVAEILLEA